MSVHPFVCLYICQSLFICLSVNILKFFCLFVCLSVSPSPSLSLRKKSIYNIPFPGATFLLKSNDNTYRISCCGFVTQWDIDIGTARSGTLYAEVWRDVSGTWTLAGVNTILVDGLWILLIKFFYRFLRTSREFVEYFNWYVVSFFKLEKR